MRILYCSANEGKVNWRRELSGQDWNETNRGGDCQDGIRVGGGKMGLEEMSGMGRLYFGPNGTGKVTSGLLTGGARVKVVVEVVVGAAAVGVVGSGNEVVVVTPTSSVEPGLERSGGAFCPPS